VHLRIQKRNARSFVEGINADITPKLLKALKKHLCCNGAIIKSQGHGSAAPRRPQGLRVRVSDCETHYFRY
jgi:translation initiation factor 1 (eIF-1/SUI1)